LSQCGFSTTCRAIPVPQGGLPSWRGNILILALLLRLIFVGFEIYYRFVCDRTDAIGNTLISVAWYSRYFHKNSLGLRDDVD